MRWNSWPRCTNCRITPALSLSGGGSAAVTGQDTLMGYVSHSAGLQLLQQVAPHARPRSLALEGDCHAHNALVSARGRRGLPATAQAQSGRPTEGVDGVPW